MTPLSLIPLRISEKASIQTSGLRAKSDGRRAKEFERDGRPSKRSRRSGMAIPAPALYFPRRRGQRDESESEPGNQERRTAMPLLTPDPTFYPSPTMAMQ